MTDMIASNEIFKFKEITFVIKFIHWIFFVGIDCV